MPELTLVEAVHAALARAMADDPAVLVLGEDVGRNGGVFRATDGLLARFGEERVLDTPLSEALLAGLGVGLAAQGFRPVVEIPVHGVHLPGHRPAREPRRPAAQPHPRAAVLPDGAPRPLRRRHQRAGASLREPGGDVRPHPGHPRRHPVLAGRRAYGLLLAAIRDPDPVVFLEPTRLYRAVREEVADDGDALPLDRCFVLREGRDLTLVTWGAMTQARRWPPRTRWPRRASSAEVIDVATLTPLDAATILASVARTGRCVIVHEAPRTAGFGAEIAARLAGEGLFSLARAGRAR